MKSETKLAHSWRFEAIGTQWEIASVLPLSNDTKVSITSYIEAFDRTYSRFNEHSLVRKAAHTMVTTQFPESAETIFSFYDSLHELTEGRVTPLVGDALVAAGYDEQYSLKPGNKAASALTYPSVVKRQGSYLTITQSTHVDIGAAGKGYLVDATAKILMDAGHESFVVDASGDLRAVGDTIERVGLEDPRDTTRALGVVELKDRALCASATNRRRWAGWHHVIDPRTGTPAEGVLATWVVAESAMVADGLATALFFVSPKALSTKYTYEYMRLNTDGSVEYSALFSKGVL